MTKEELMELFKLAPIDALKAQKQGSWTPVFVAWFWPRYRHYHPKLVVTPNISPDPVDVQAVLQMFPGAKEIS